MNSDTETLKDDESDEGTLKGDESDEGTLKDFDVKSDNELSKESDVESDYEYDDEDWQVFQDDLRIFGYELYHYFIARCFYFNVYPRFEPLTIGSKFTEEFGKAVIVTWHKAGKKYIQMLHDDYPRYIDRTDNFQRYVLYRVKEMINEYGNTETEQIIMISAFLFDIYICCAANNHFQFLPNFFDYWSELISVNFDNLIKNERWQTVRKDCLTLYKEYDEEKIEVDVEDLLFIRVKTKYFMRDEDAENCLKKGKMVSRFYTLNQELQSVILPRHPCRFRSREETLNIISSSKMQDKFFDAIREADDLMNKFLRPYVLEIYDYKHLPNTSTCKNQRRRKK